MLVREITTELFDAVLFDNDGTLIDSRGPVVRSWLAWVADHGVPVESLVGFDGVPSSSIVASVAPHLDPVAATVDIDRRELADLEEWSLYRGPRRPLQQSAGEARSSPPRAASW